MRKVAAETGLLLRRCNVAQFVIVYAYFKPDAAEPNGLVSLRAFRHASKEDVFWAVRESTETALRDVPEDLWLRLSTRLACTSTVFVWKRIP